MPKKDKANISQSKKPTPQSARLGSKYVGTNLEPRFLGVKKVEAFNRWLKESYPEYKQKLG